MHVFLLRFLLVLSCFMLPLAAQECPNGETEFWDFADIDGAGTGAPNPTPHDAVNAQAYTAQGAILTLAGAPVLNNGATLDEYFVDDVHLNGNFSVRTGMDMPLAGGGPNPATDANLVQTWTLSQPVNNLSIFINDVDGQDVAVINASLNGTIVQLTPADFTFNPPPAPPPTTPTKAVFLSPSRDSSTSWKSSTTIRTRTAAVRSR